jgi:hypothetical protein
MNSPKSRSKSRSKSPRKSGSKVVTKSSSKQVSKSSRITFNPKPQIQKVLEWNLKIMNGYIMGLCHVLGLKASFGRQILNLFTSAMAWYIKYNMTSRVVQVSKDTEELTKELIDAINFFSRKMGKELVHEIKNNAGKITGCVLSQGMISNKIIPGVEYLEAEQMITVQTNRVVSDLFTDFLKDVKNKMLPETESVSAQLLRNIGIQRTPVSTKNKETWKEWTRNGLCDSAFNTGYIPTKILSYGCELEQLTTRSCVEFSKRIEATTHAEVNILISKVQEYHTKWLKNIKPQAEYVAFDYITCMVIYFLISTILSIILKTTDSAYKGLRKLSRTRSSRR